MIKTAKEESSEEDFPEDVGAREATDAAAKELLETLGDLEEEYIGLLKIVEEYGDVYEKTYKQQKEKSEQDFKDLESRFDKNQISCKMQNYIKSDIHPKFYNEKLLKDDIEEARKSIGSMNWNCLEFSLSVKQKDKQYLDELKKYKDRVKGWFDDLDKLYKEADKLIDQREYKAAYAYTVEFKRVFDKVSELKDEKTLESNLTKYLATWIKSAYNYFYFNNKNMKIQAKYTKAKEKYQIFLKEELKELRNKFVKEVKYLTDEDIPE